MGRQSDGNPRFIERPASAGRSCSHREPTCAVESARADPRSERIQRLFEWPVIVAALLTIPILFIQESDLGQPWQTMGTLLCWGTWLTFATEVAV